MYYFVLLYKVFIFNGFMMKNSNKLNFLKICNLLKIFLDESYPIVFIFSYVSVFTYFLYFTL